MPSLDCQVRRLRYQPPTEDAQAGLIPNLRVLDPRNTKKTQGNLQSYSRM